MMIPLKALELGFEASVVRWSEVPKTLGIMGGILLLDLAAIIVTCRRYFILWRFAQSKFKPVSNVGSLKNRSGFQWTIGCKWRRVGKYLFRRGKKHSDCILLYLSVELNLSRAYGNLETKALTVCSSFCALAPLPLMCSGCCSLQAFHSIPLTHLWSSMARRLPMACMKECGRQSGGAAWRAAERRTAGKCLR